MNISIITLFPDFFKPFLEKGAIKRALERKLVEINLYNLRNWAIDKRGTVDDKPYGGGAGMILMVEPIYEAINFVKSKSQMPKSEIQKTKIVLLSPRGKVWTQEKAQEYSKLDNLILICGHYEGVDERVRNFVDEEISIGDFILTGGEIPAMVLTDSIVRLIPGALEKPEATQKESFSNLNAKTANFKLLEYPQYTRPVNFKGLRVPEVLLSGNHQEIEKWRAEQALEITKKLRPDLLK